MPVLSDPQPAISAAQLKQAKGFIAVIEAETGLGPVAWLKKIGEISTSSVLKRLIQSLLQVTNPRHWNIRTLWALARLCDITKIKHHHTEHAILWAVNRRSRTHKSDCLDCDDVHVAIVQLAVMGVEDRSRSAVAEDFLSTVSPGLYKYIYELQHHVRYAPEQVLERLDEDVDFDEFLMEVLDQGILPAVARRRNSADTGEVASRTPASASQAIAADSSARQTHQRQALAPLNVDMLPGRATTDSVPGRRHSAPGALGYGSAPILPTAQPELSTLPTPPDSSDESSPDAPSRKRRRRSSASASDHAVAEEASQQGDIATCRPAKKLRKRN